MSALKQFAYDDRGTALAGWLVRPEGAPRGGIVVYPTVANLTDGVEVKARLLAKAGFLVLVADYYGEPITSFEGARELANVLRADVDHFRTRLSAAVAALRALPDAAGLTLGAVGFCLGGQAVLELARAGEDLAIAASFHGLLDTARKADGPVPARILVCHGDRDPMVPREQVLAFWEEMDAVAADWHFHSYSNVKHGFTDPASDTRGMAAVAYDASADRQSWAALNSLLDEVFG